MAPVALESGELHDIASKTGPGPGEILQRKTAAAVQIAFQCPHPYGCISGYVVQHGFRIAVFPVMHLQQWSCGQNAEQSESCLILRIRVMRFDLLPWKSIEKCRCSPL